MNFRAGKFGVSNSIKYNCPVKKYAEKCRKLIFVDQTSIFSNFHYIPLKFKLNHMISPK